MTNINKIIKDYRQQRKMTQNALAKLSGMSQRDISNFENARTDIRLSTLLQLAQALDLSLMLIPKLQAEEVAQLINPQTSSENKESEPSSLLERFGISDD